MEVDGGKKGVKGERETEGIRDAGVRWGKRKSLGKECHIHESPCQN